MPKKTTPKPKLVKDEPKETKAIKRLEAFRRTDSEAIVYLGGCVKELEARLDRIVAAASKARPITKDM